VSNAGGSQNQLLRDMQLGSQRELKDAYVLDSLEGCAAEYRGGRKLEREKMLTSIFALEGLISIVACAVATVTRDVPLVIHTLFTQLCALFFSTPSIPPPVQNMLEWCVASGLCAKKVDPAMDAAGWEALCQSFWKLVDPKCAMLKEYLLFVEPHMRMGCNSLFMLDRILSTLIVNGKTLTYSSSTCNTVPKAPSAVPTPKSVPKGYEHAPTAVWFISEQLGLDVTKHFTDAENGSNLPHMSDYGPHLIGGERNRLYKNRGWDAVKPDFPGYPQSEWLFCTEDGTDALRCFQPLAVAHCPFRPCYSVASRQADVGLGDNFRASEVPVPPSRFINEHIVLQLAGKVVGKTVEEIKGWMKIMAEQSNPRSTKSPGSRIITSEAQSTHASIHWTDARGRCVSMCL
jgi:hypothetical protein